MTTTGASLRPEFIKHLGIGLHQADEVLGVEHAWRAAVSAGLSEALEFIGAGTGRVEQDGLWMPGVAFDQARSRMVASNSENIRFLAKENGKRSVEFFDGLALGRKVAVLSIHVRIFVMDEEIVVIVVFGEVALELFGNGLRPFKFCHANELGEAFVHWIDGDAAGAQAVSLLKARNFWLMSDAAEQKAVCRLAFLDDGQRGLVKIRDQFGRFLCFDRLWVQRLDFGNGQPFPVRIGVGQRTFEAFAPKENDEAMAFARFDNDLCIANLFDVLRKKRAKFFADRSIDAACATISYDAFFIERAEVRASSNIPNAELKAKTQRFNDTAADLKFERIVAEESEMTRTAAGSDAGRDGDHPALSGLFRESVKVGSHCGFERGEVVLVARGEIAEAVKNEQNKLGIGFQRQFGIQSVKIHSSIQSQIVRVTEWQVGRPGEADDAENRARAQTRFRAY